MCMSVSLASKSWSSSSCATLRQRCSIIWRLKLWETTEMFCTIMFTIKEKHWSVANFPTVFQIPSCVPVHIPHIECRASSWMSRMAAVVLNGRSRSEPGTPLEQNSSSDVARFRDLLWLQIFQKLWQLWRPVYWSFSVIGQYIRFISNICPRFLVKWLFFLIEKLDKIWFSKKVNVCQTVLLHTASPSN